MIESKGTVIETDGKRHRQQYLPPAGPLRRWPVLAGASSVSPMWMAGTQTLSHLPWLFPGRWQGASSEPDLSELHFNPETLDALKIIGYTFY